MKYLEVCLQTSIFAPLFNRKRISLDYGVMVAQQVLVLFVQVRILVVQQSNSLEDCRMDVPGNQGLLYEKIHFPKRQT